MRSIFNYILLTAFLIPLLSGCTFRPGHKVYTYAEELLSSGELTEAVQVSEEILKSYDLNTQEKIKIDSILEMSYRIRKDFTLSDSEVVHKLSRYHPYMDDDDLLKLEKANKIDVKIIDGEKKYFKNCVNNLFRLDTVYARLRAQIDGVKIDSLSLFRVANTSTILANDENFGMPVNPVKMRISYSIRVHADAVPAGDTIRCWMPYPRENSPRQRDIHLLKTNPVNYSLSPATDLQRSLYMEQISVLGKQTIFHTELEYNSFAQSFQLLPEMIRPYQKESQLYKEYTAEKSPQIVFNTRIKSLAKNILHGETNPLLQVRLIYHWINDSVTWASALEYCIMPDIPGFVMERRHGDCGMQTLLFMSLARSLGIPVKWQSGWMLHPPEVNLHDWAEVWFEGIGWVPVDQSFGLQNISDPRVRDFYMSGIDAYRLIVNDDFSQPLTPVKKFFRSEPYDFQRGEVEWKGGNLYFDKWSWHMDVSYQ